MNFAWFLAAIALCLIRIESAYSAEAMLPEASGTSLPLSCLTSALAIAEGLQGQGGEVRVEMTFMSAQAAPSSKVLSNTGGALLADLALRHVANYRLPCLESGRSVVLVQDIAFSVGDANTSQVLASQPHYALADANASMTAGCTVEGVGKEMPNFPGNSLGRPLNGTVVVEMRFEDRDRPPATTVLFDGGDSLFVQGVLDAVGNYRLRCDRPLPRPVVRRQLFSFERSGGGKARLLPQLNLQQLLSTMDDSERKTMPLGAATLSCPFQVAFAPFEPYAENNVYADLRNHPERREFVAWLRKVDLKLPTATMRTAIGVTSTISVPCAEPEHG